jgi:chromosome segregation ATPase
MTIDERLERLTDRHEALSQTLELLTHDIDALRDALRTEGKETGEKIRALAILAEQNEVRAERMRAATARSFEAIRDSLQRLERIATAHERRIADLETKAPG